ncbi:MAG: hypothetical protein JXR88_06860 [Clostridia bacterium]|nr:hypothetical protein [Clostridia bacterium]
MTIYYLHALALDYFNFSKKKANLLEVVLSKLTTSGLDQEQSIYLHVWCVALGLSYVEEQVDERYKVAWDAEIMEMIYQYINDTIEENINSINREAVFKDVEYTFELVKEISFEWHEEELLSYYMKLEQLFLHKRTHIASESIVMEFLENIDFNIILSNYWRNFFTELEIFLQNRTLIN